MRRGCDPDAGSTGVTITATHGWYTIFQNRGHAQWRRFRQADAGRAPSRPFLPSALQRRPGAQSRERLLDQRPEQGDEAERHDGTDEPVGEENAEASLRSEQRL